MSKINFINKQNEKEKNKEYLSRKRIEPDSKKEEIDMLKLKKKINGIMMSICNEINESTNDLNILYDSMHKNYILNEFTSNCLKYINKIVLDIRKNHLKKFQSIFELNRIFVSIIKELLMNEFELLLLSLYLESIDLSSCKDIISFKDSLIYLCYFIKKITLSSEKISPIYSFLNRKYQNFEDKFKKWFEYNSSIFNNKLYFSYSEVNTRFKEYNQSHSIYCKNNYIDYNLIIDRILTMSIPYNESKTDNLFIDTNINKDLGKKRNNEIINYNNSLENKINIEQKFLFNNDNINNLNNYINKNITINSEQIYLSKNNNNNNNLNNILTNEQLKINKELSEQKFQVTDIKKTNIKTEQNKKIIFKTQEQKNDNKEDKEENDENEKKITLNNLLDNYNLNNNNYKHKNSNNNIITNNENNIFGLNISQQINNQSKYNLGINDINSLSRLSLFSFENPHFIEFKNLYNNVFQGQENENMKHLINQSNDNFLKSGLDIKGIYSSKNFYSNINNNNYININENNNNINYLNINQMINGNPNIFNSYNNLHINENQRENNIYSENNNKNNENININK